MLFRTKTSKKFLYKVHTKYIMDSAMDVLKYVQ